MGFKFDLLEIENVGEIELGDKARISDPCYRMDTWCAGTLEDILPGKYDCYMQKVDTGGWGVRVASIEVKHKNYSNIESNEIQDIDVGVDSGQAGVYDLDYFVENRGNKSWYLGVGDATYRYVRNPKYVPFEDSEFCSETEYKTIHYAFNNYLPINDTLSKEVVEYYEAWDKYRNNICSVKMIPQFTASTLDGKCLVSSSGDGDGIYTCLVGRNEDGKIVTIKIDYYYGYDEDYEEEEDEYC